jgi:hypothetical protein
MEWKPHGSASHCADASEGFRKKKPRSRERGWKGDYGVIRSLRAGSAAGLQLAIRVEVIEIARD